MATGPLAQLMMDMVEAGTPEQIPLAPDAVVWHNYDQAEIPAATNMASLLALRAAFPDLRFDDLRVSHCGHLSIAQWVFTVTLPEGDVVRAPGCFVVHERDGRIVRVEEYMDSAQLAPVAAAIGQQSQSD
jgi:ketosteroid isomerase-like protein